MFEVLVELLQSNPEASVNSLNFDRNYCNLFVLQ